MPTKVKRGPQIAVAVTTRRKPAAAAPLAQPNPPIIVKTPGVCGGNARVAGTRIPVWGLENSRQLGLSASEIIERYPMVTAEALSAAWKYAAKHPREIERQIADNNRD